MFLKIYIMKPSKHKSTELDIVLCVHSRRDLDGEIYFYVDYMFADTSVSFRFKQMSTIVDFIKSNF